MVRRVGVVLLALLPGSFAVTAALESEAHAAPPSRPDWCGTSYKPSDDTKAKWVDGYIKSEGWSDRVRNYMALGGCDKPDDAERQKQIALLNNGFRLNSYAGPATNGGAGICI